MILRDVRFVYSITHGSPPFPAILSGRKELYYFLDPQKAATAEPAIHRAIEANSFLVAWRCGSNPSTNRGFLYMSLSPLEASLGRLLKKSKAC